MDVQDVGLSADRRPQPKVRIPTYTVIDLLSIAQELRERAAYISNYSAAHSNALRSCAVRVQAIADSANK